MSLLPDDTGERRRRSDAAPVIADLIADLIDEATIVSIAEEAWQALVADEEYLVPMPGPLPADPVSSWVDIAGPWSGAVVLACGRQTTADLARCLLARHAPPVLDEEDVEYAFGELANVVGGNVKAVLPGPSALGLPEVGSAPEAGSDVCRVDLLWRGQSLTISVQGSAGALTEQNNPQKNEVPL